MSVVEQDLPLVQREQQGVTPAAPGETWNRLQLKAYEDVGHLTVKQALRAQDAGAEANATTFSFDPNSPVPTDGQVKIEGLTAAEIMSANTNQTGSQELATEPQPAGLRPVPDGPLPSAPAQNALEKIS